MWCCKSLLSLLRTACGAAASHRWRCYKHLAMFLRDMGRVAASGDERCCQLQATLLLKAGDYTTSSRRWWYRRHTALLRGSRGSATGGMPFVATVVSHRSYRRGSGDGGMRWCGACRCALMGFSTCLFHVPFFPWTWGSCFEEVSYRNNICGAKCTCQALRAGD
jgi:hypothetical protein